MGDLVDLGHSFAGFSDLFVAPEYPDCVEEFQVAAAEGRNFGALPARGA